MANTLRFKRGLASGLPTGVAGEPLFTTDTFDLYIGTSGGNQRFQKYIASGTTSQYLRGDGSLATFPTNVITGTGVAGQVAYWSGASTQAGSNNLFWDITNGRLGIGTNAPTRTLQVQGTGFFSDSVQVQRDFIGATSIRVGNTGTVDAATLMQFVLSEDGATNNGYFRRYRNGSALTEIGFSNALAFTGAVTGTAAERMRIHSGGNVHIGGTGDSGQRLQVTGTGYFSDSVGIGTTVLTAYNLHIGKNITGSFPFAVWQDGTVQSTASNIINGFQNSLRTQAASFVISEYNHFSVEQYALGAGSSVTSQKGFNVDNTMTGATNNYGFFGNIASGTGRWNLYMNGTAANYLNGNTGIGVTNPSQKLDVLGAIVARGRNFIASFDAGTGDGILMQAFVGYGELKTNNNGHYMSFVTGTTERMRLTSTNGNLHLGTFSSDSGERLQVNGTMKVTGATTFSAQLNTAAVNFLANTNHISSEGRLRLFFVGNSETRLVADGFRFRNNATSDLIVVSSTGAATFSSSVTAASLNVTGASTFGGNVSLRLDQNAETKLTITNGISGVAAQARLDLVTNVGSGRVFTMSLNSPTTTAYKMLAVNDAIIYSNELGDIAILNDFASGSIKMAAGGSSTAQFTIASSGAATFSSSVQAGGNLLLTNGTASSIGAINLIRTGASPVSSRLTFGTDGTGYSFAIGKNQGGTITDFVTILDSGAANFSSSIQAATAIAIGTTPDTNKPFKILKNINATVGINFENTSTSSLAFSAIQMGTDVTGGTKFTNLVYASSGVTANGVYNPDGTSLINNGGGGLNFLGNPIRLYTGGSNGVLRLMLDNEGTTQYNATTPTTNATDGYKQYSADVVAGNAAPHFRTENGAVVKLYQETTSVGNSIISLGGGLPVLDDTTFDGYTLRQIVKALRNQGILA